MEKNGTNGKRQLLEIRKYQNRRYYDTTNSTHLSLEQIHKKICEGYDVRVVDAKTEEDITAKVLTQILLEYEPMKLDFFSNDMLLQVIRVNDNLLKEFYDKYFGDAFALFVKSRKQFESFLHGTPFMPHISSGFGMPSFSGMTDAYSPFTSMFGSKREEAAPKDLAGELDALRRQVEDLKAAVDRK